MLLSPCESPIPDGKNCNNHLETKNKVECRSGELHVVSSSTVTHPSPALIILDPIQFLIIPRQFPALPQVLYIYIYNLLQLAHKNLKAIPSKCYAIYIFLGFESWTSRIHYRHFATAMIQRNPAFSSLNSDDINHFKGILGDKNVIEDEDALLFANTDWMRKYKGSSRLLLQPRTTQEVLYISFIN